MRENAAIAPSQIRVLSDWQDQRCPICRKSLGDHIIIEQAVEADFPGRLLNLRAEGSCGKPSEEF